MISAATFSPVSIALVLRKTARKKPRITGLADCGVQFTGRRDEGMFVGRGKLL
jgi:hypothetical protein